MADQELDIEVGEPGASKAARVPLPQNYATIGSIDNDDLKVYIRQDVYKHIEKWSKSDTAKELGSILIGDYSEEMGKRHVVISDCIEAKHTDATASTLTFTHETWEDVHSRMNREFADKKIVGWQHTHPSYGIFLSNYDLFIQENFFNLSFQVAYVVDPIADTRGFFQWKQGQIQKLAGFNIYDELGKKIYVGDAKATKRTGTRGTAPASLEGFSKIWFAAFIIMLACLLGLGYSTFRANEHYQALQAEQRTVSGKMAQYERIAASQQQDLAEQQKLTADLRKELEQSNAKLAELQQSVNDRPTIVEAQPVAVPAVDADPSTVRFVAYTVQAGDTLSRICQDHGISYRDYDRAIRSANGLDEAGSIQAGQVLLLPVSGG